MTESRDYLKDYNIDTVAEALNTLCPQFTVDAWRVELVATQREEGVGFLQSVVIALVDNAAEIREQEQDVDAIIADYETSGLYLDNFDH